jgi:Flp pilus assembly protein TadD
MRVPAVFASALLSLSLSHGALAMTGDLGPPVPGVTEAKALIDKDKFADAIPHLQAALKAAPANADVLNLLGFTHRKTGKFDDAEGFYKKALDVNSNHLGALNYLGQLYIETGRLEEAKKMLARLDKACFFGCKEYDALKQAVSTGTAGKY